MAVLKNTCQNPYFNLAFDEYCLEQVPWSEPVFYLWQNKPAVILGRNQEPYSQVNMEFLAEHHILLARRITGGGAVYHDLGNLNFTIIYPNVMYALQRDFQSYLMPMVSALRSMGIDCSFSGRNDILMGGKKISGCAKRYSNGNLMVHGTLLFSVDLQQLEAVLYTTKDGVESKGVASVKSKVTNLCTVLPHIHSVTDFQAQLEQACMRELGEKHVILSKEQLSEIQQEAETKFSTKAWIYGEAPPVGICRAHKFSCGTVELHMKIENGLISEIRFCGDFIGSAPISQLEQMLIGCPYEQAAVEKCFIQCPLNLYFEKMDKGQLIEFMFTSF